MAPPTASTTDATTSIGDAAPSSCRPPWFETMMPSTPRRTASARVAGVEDALQEQRPVPGAPQVVDVGPGHAGVEELAHPAGEGRGIRRFPRPDVVAEGDPRQLPAHPPEPAGPGQGIGDPREARRRRDGEAVPQVALPVADELVVDRQDEAIVACRLRPLRQFPREAPVLVDEDLHPPRRGAGRGDGLEGRDGPVAEAEADARFPGRAGGAAFAVGPEETRQAGRPDDEGHGQAMAEQRDRGVPRGGAAERPRQERDLREGGLVAAERRFGLGAAVGEVEDGPWQGSAGEAAHRVHAGGLASPVLHGRQRSSR